MAGRVLPGAQLTAFYGRGADGWDTPNDDTMRKASAFLSLSPISLSAALPANPVAGQIFIVPANAQSNANQIAVYDVDGWHYYTPFQGQSAYVQDQDKDFRWDNNKGWYPIIAQVAVTNPVPPLVFTQSLTLTNTHKGRLLVADGPANKSLLIPAKADMANMSPPSGGFDQDFFCLVCWRGAGILSFGYGSVANPVATVHDIRDIDPPQPGGQGCTVGIQYLSDDVFNITGPLVSA